ncbi:PASTA domain-containing protein [Micromonospora purpureochromogenes]|uniref:PASTA domain-containing protein n=1 Tax=Micromonospora purpureochromogenes TaxID=47872 RepID=UPI0033C8C88F
MTNEPPTTPWLAHQPPPAAPPGPAFLAAPPPPAKRKLGKGAIVGIVVGAVVLCCCGLGGINAVFGDDDKPAAQASPSAQAVAERVVPSIVPTTAAPTTAAPSPSAVVTTAPAPPPAPTTVVMPNLVGMNAAVAQDKLQQLGLTKIQLGSQDENDTVVLLAANWTVTKQSHRKGTKVALDELVVLTCTKQR